MSRQLRAIQIDPYFDGERDGGGMQQAPPRDMGRPVTPPSQYGYQDVANFQTATGAPMSGVMRPGPEGLRGTVIPRATMGGIPQGTRPHVTQDIEVNIDPHIDGQSSRVRLGDLNERSIYEASQLAAQVTPEPTSIETLRLRGSAIMHGIAQQAQAHAQGQPQHPQEAPRQTLMTPPGQQSHQQPQQPVVVQPNQSPGYQLPPQQPRQQPQQPQYQQPQQPQPQQPQRMRRVSPLSAFNQQPAAPQPQVRELREIDMREPAAAVGPPQIQVTFEMEHFGNLEVRYHDVVIQDGFIVLIFDTRHTNSTKYFPPTATSDNAPAMALNVAGTPDVYLVQTTGIQYTHEGREHCILMVERTVTLSPEEM